MHSVRTAIGLATAMALAMPAATASAGASSYEERQIAHFYNNADYALFTGPTFDLGCLEEGFIESRSHIVSPDESREMVESTFEDTVNLYDLSQWGVTDPIELLDLACEAVVSGEGDVPTPIASGEAVIKSRERVSPLPDGFVIRAQNSVLGDVATESGQVWSVHARAKFTITVRGDSVDENVQFVDLDLKGSGS
ncbi:MAG: hypothetical protein WA962_10180 [Ornithinimicrobium sp.]